MSNKTRLQTNNTNLQNLINKANNLPDAGSGGGSVETCTVTVQNNLLETIDILGTYYENNSWSSYCASCADGMSRVLIVPKQSYIIFPINFWTGCMVMTSARRGPMFDSDFASTEYSIVYIDDNDTVSIMLSENDLPPMP